MFKDTPEGTTHYFGDGCNPAHRCPDGTCKPSRYGNCLVCNVDIPKKHVCCDGECNHDDCCGKVSENCPLRSTPEQVRAKRGMNQILENREKTSHPIFVPTPPQEWGEGDTFITTSVCRKMCEDLLHSERERVVKEIGKKIKELENAKRQLKGHNNTPSRRVLNGKITVLSSAIALIENK